MASAARAPKQWQLKKNEDINSFNNWKENLLYSLSLDANMKPFLMEGVRWGKKTRAAPHRGFTDDADGTANRKTKEEKCANLNLMLGQIASWATVISRKSITEKSTCLGDIWNAIREHYHILNTGAGFLDLSNIVLQTDESSEDLYQRILAFFDDNLQTVGSNVQHHGVLPTVDEEMSPTVENVTVLLWLERLHVGLPALVKQRYGAELRNKSLASIKSEISLAIRSLLEELKTSDNSTVLRIHSKGGRRDGNDKSRGGKPRSKRYCCLCRTANRAEFESHYLSQCPHLPAADKVRFSNVRNIEMVDDSDAESSSEHSCDSDGEEQDLEEEVSESESAEDPNNGALPEGDPSTPPATTRRVSVRKSAVLKCFYKHSPISVILDSGSESNLVSNRCAKELDLVVSKSKQRAVQADKKAMLKVLGEVKGFKFVRGAYVLKCDALVVEADVGDVVGGEPFLEDNDIYVRSAKKQIIIQDKEIISYADS